MRYDNGQEVSADYKSPTEMTWETMNGPAIGTNGTERIYAAEVALDVFFISWVEEEGVTTSHIVDFVNARVTSFVTYEAPRGRQSVFNTGTFTELPAAGESA